MTDIIQDAKKLLDGATPGPWVVYTRSFGVIDAIGPIERDLTEGLDVDSGSAELAAAAPELAQALAEETWEYAQEIYFNGKWQPIYEDLWYDNPEECESLFLDIEPWKWNNEPVRIVRRRVSPPEVVSE